MTSAVRALLDEISWEGNARKYRGGGAGLENVLTTEVFQALDLLPRDDFLGRVLRAAGGADRAREHAAASVERAVVSVLPGESEHPELGLRVQPDVVIESGDSWVLVEAKRVRRSRFAPEQLAREVLVAERLARGPHPLLLVVTGHGPPFPVEGHGSLGLGDAARLGADLMSRRLDRRIELPDPERVVAHITWDAIADTVRVGLESISDSDSSVGRSVARVASCVVDAVQAHSAM